MVMASNKSVRFCADVQCLDPQITRATLINSDVHL